MTVRHHELTQLIDQYRAGIDAELMLLHRLHALAVDQRRATETGSLTELQETIHRRDRVMATLLIVDQEFRNVRQRLLSHREHLADKPAFGEIVALHREAADLVADIVVVDEYSVGVLRWSSVSSFLRVDPLPPSSPFSEAGPSLQARWSEVSTVAGDDPVRTKLEESVAVSSQAQRR